MHVLEILIVAVILVAVLWPFVGRRSQRHVSITPEFIRRPDNDTPEQSEPARDFAEPWREMFRRAAHEPLPSPCSNVPSGPSPILIVASERVIADTLSIILKQYGYPAVTAYDGAEAVTKARELRPWFVLSDVIMPRMNGIEAAIRIRREHPGCEILLFSGQAATADLLNLARELGFEFEIIATPIHPRDLLDKLEKAKAQRQVQQT